MNWFYRLIETYSLKLNFWAYGKLKNTKQTNWLNGYNKWRKAKKWKSS